MHCTCVFLFVPSLNIGFSLFQTFFPLITLLKIYSLWVTFILCKRSYPASIQTRTMWHLGATEVLVHLYFFIWTTIIFWPHIIFKVIQALLLYCECSLFLPIFTNPSNWLRVIFMEDHIPIRPDRSLLFGFLNGLYWMWSTIKITLYPFCTLILLVAWNNTQFNRIFANWEKSHTW